MKQLIFSFKQNTIKAVVVKQNGNVFDVLTGGTIELSPGSIEAGTIKKYDEVKENLSKLIGGISEAKSLNIIVLLSEEAGFLKILKRGQDKDSLQNPEVQEDIPYPIKGSFTSLRLLPNKSIQLVTTPKDLISTYQKLFKDLGLELNSVIPEPVIFLPFLAGSTKPNILISAEGGSILFSVISQSGVYFSTTKNFKGAVFNKGQVAGWVKEVIEGEIKKISPTLDFEAVVFGEHDEEILEILKESDTPTRQIDVRFGNIPTQLGDIGSFKKLIITARSDKQMPGFHIKGVREIVSGQIIIPKVFPKINWKVAGGVLFLLLIISGLVWTVPKVLDTFSGNETNKITTPIQPIATPSASATKSATPSAKKEATKSVEKKEELKPILKKSSLRIEVLNGSGVVGTAGEGSNFLTNKGYKVVSTGNASNYNFTKTEVRIKKSKEDFLSLLTKDLSSNYTVIKGESLNESASFDAQVIIGKN